MRRAERQTVCINHRQEKHVSSNVCLLLSWNKNASRLPRPCFPEHFRTEMGHTHACIGTYDKLRSVWTHDCLKKKKNYLFHLCLLNYQHFCLPLALMWEMDHKESWVPKNWCFWIKVLEKTLERSLDSKIKSVNPKGNQPWIFTGRTDVETEIPILLPPDA